MKNMISSLILLATQLPSVVTVTPRDRTDYIEPQIAIENDGYVYVTYGSGNTVYVSVSSDKGKTYGAPIKVSESGKLSLGMRRGPRISAIGGKVTITAIFGSTGNGSDGDIFSFRSVDHGQTWANGSKVNDVDASAREGLHAMAVSPDGTVACAWLDLRSKGTKLFMATSKDNGGSWSKNQLVYQSPGGSICECCHPSLAYDDRGKLMIMFRNSLNGARDMYLTSTVNDGVSFSAAMKLGDGTWNLNACPMDGGMLFAGEPGSVGTAWRREKSVFFYAQGNDLQEISLGAGKQPWVAVGPSGDVFAIWSSPNGLMTMTLGKPAQIIAPQGLDPVVSSSPDRKTVVAAWADGGIKSALLTK